MRIIISYEEWSLQTFQMFCIILRSLLDYFKKIDAQWCGQIGYLNHAYKIIVPGFVDRQQSDVKDMAV